MAYVKIGIHKRNLDIRKKGIKDWNVSEEDKKDLLKFLNDLELGKVNNGKKISENRQVKYLDILKVPMGYFYKNMKKPLAKVTLKDVEKFEKDLGSDIIRSQKRGLKKIDKNLPYSEASKVDFRRMIKIFLRWKIGEEKSNKLCGWFDLKVPRKTPDYLTEKEITDLYKHCKNNSERFLIAVLFDSGARAEEFHNIRFEDIQIPTGEESFIKLTLKEEYSKTKGRTISLYWKNSFEAIKDYIEERKSEGIKSNEPVFSNSYDNTRQFLNRIGNKVLKRSIHYHLFRHSSATFYATKLNRQELCYRYGWAFSSDMPDVYISRAGMESKELDTKFETTELSELKNKLSKGEFERKKQAEDLEKMKKILFKLTQERDDAHGIIAVRELSDEGEFPGSISDAGMLPPNENIILKGSKRLR